jgi:hypothetical protein
MFIVTILYKYFAPTARFSGQREVKLKFPDNGSTIAQG